MKKVPYSAYLQEIEPKLKQLLELLEPEYGFVSVLSADTTGAAYRIGQKNKVIMEPMTCERGSVVRTVRNKRIHEYSFSSMEDPKDAAEKIREAAEREDQLLDAENIEDYPTPDIQEEECRLSVEKEAEILPEDLSAEEIISRLKKISDEGAAEDPRILECVAYLSSTHVSKLYLSARKTMRQSYLFTEGMIMAVARENEDVRSDYSVYSDLGGLELLDEMNHNVHTVVQNTLQLLGAPRVEPGEYDIITTPGVSGLIAHEAFGHGVEMDMFVKNRALGAHYINKRVGSGMVTMHEGALAAQDTASFAFDDEGTPAGNVTEIDRGILKSGVSDLLSALRLGTVPTGNGRRESCERKAYARMTNTLFTGGTDTLEDMIASIRHGYLLEGMESGMEDPKNWGIQCILVKGREIRDGKLTGKVVSPVIMTGYVPDLLGSISMATPDVYTDGCGFCGKGHKEWVKVSEGGPYLKARGRLG